MKNSALRFRKALTRFIVVGFLVVCLPQISYASHSDTAHSGFEFGFYGGYSDADVKTNGLVVAPNQIDTLVNKGGDDGDFTPGVSAAYRFVLAPLPNKQKRLLPSISLGLAFFSLCNTQKGDTLQFGQADLDNYTYHLEIRTIRLMLDTQLNFHPLVGTVFPFVEIAVGVARIKTLFNEAPRAETGVFDGQINLASLSNYHFVYSFGAGIKIPVSRDFLISVGYLYTDFGHFHTSKQSDHFVVAQPIRIAMHTNTGLVGIIYLLP